MKEYIWGKYKWKCQRVEEFFDHVWHDTVVRAFVDTRPVLFNRLFMKGKWEHFSETELAEQLVRRNLLIIREV